MERKTLETGGALGASCMENGDVLVSVIIPVYNVAAYLPQCVDSVIRQSYRTLEILLIDDGSTDSSPAICERYARLDDRVRVVHTENCGVACARNTGLELARGAYLFFLDSDDWLALHTIETLLKAALSTRAEVAVGWICREYVESSVSTLKYPNQLRVYQDKGILSAMVRGTINDSACNKLFRADCFSDIRFPVGRNSEDIATIWRIMAKLASNGGTAAVVLEDLYHYRMRTDSISHTKSLRNVMDCWDAAMSKYTGLPEYQAQLLPACYRALGGMWLNYCGFSGEEKLGADETFREMLRFSKAHAHELLRSRCRTSVKLTCLITQTRALPVLWACYCGGKLRRLSRQRGYHTFD